MNGYMMHDEEEDPKLMGALTQGTSQQVAPVPVAPPPTMAPPAMRSIPQLPQTPPPAPAAPPAMPPALPGMPQGVTADEISQYVTGNKQKIDRFGADDQMNLQQQNNDRRNSMSNRIISGGKGLADAIMMGVAGAGNPNWQGQFQDQENRLAAENMDTMRSANSANMQKVSTDMNLDRMDPNSLLSKSSQDTYSPLFEKLGYPADAIKKMSAANIDSALPLMAQFGGKQVEAMIKKYEAEMAGAEFEETKRHNRAAEGQQAVDDQRNAASELLKRSGNARVWGIPVPFTSDVSGKEEDAARKTLMGQIQPASEAPYGDVTERGGFKYQWSPSTKKYHKVGNGQ